MRPERELAADAWYGTSTDVNNDESIFLSERVVRLFMQTLREADTIFAFKLRGLNIEANRVSFFIKPDDGFELPAIMKWLKQTFAARFNVMMKRTGHIWGAQGCTRTGERVAVSRQYGVPLTQALPRTRPTGPIGTGRAYWRVNRRHKRHAYRRRPNERKKAPALRPRNPAKSGNPHRITAKTRRFIQSQPFRQSADMGEVCPDGIAVTANPAFSASPGCSGGRIEPFCRKIRVQSDG
jgi:REP element-mobilizing transposase RayT